MRHCQLYVGGRQRDLPPLPLLWMSAEDFGAEGHAVPAEDLDAHQSRLHTLIVALNYEYSNRRAPEHCWPPAGAVSKAQLPALKKLCRQVGWLIALEPSPLRRHDWSAELKHKKIAYVRRERGHDAAHAHAASNRTIEVFRLVVSRRPSTRRPWPQGASANASSTWRQCCDPPVVGYPHRTGVRCGLHRRSGSPLPGSSFERGIIGPIEGEDVATFDGEMILNGAFEVEKVRDPPIILEDGSEVPALRLVLNLIPSSACQLPIDRDIAELYQLAANSARPCWPRTRLYSGAARTESVSSTSSGCRELGGLGWH